MGGDIPSQKTGQSKNAEDSLLRRINGDTTGSDSGEEKEKPSALDAFRSELIKTTAPVLSVAFLRAPLGDADVTKAQEGASESNKKIMGDLAVIKNKGASVDSLSNLRERLNTDLQTRVDALRTLASNDKLPNMESSLLKSFEFNATTKFRGNTLAQNVAILDAVADRLKKSGNPELVQLGKDFAPPAVCSLAIKGAHIPADNRKLREDVQKALVIPINAPAETLQSRFTEQALSYLSGRDVLAPVQAVFGQAFNLNLRMLKNDGSAAEQNRIAGLLGLSPDEAKVVNERYIQSQKAMTDALAVSRSTTAARVSVDSKTASGADKGAAGRVVLSGGDTTVSNPILEEPKVKDFLSLGTRSDAQKIVSSKMIDYLPKRFLDGHGSLKDFNNDELKSFADGLGLKYDPDKTKDRAKLTATSTEEEKANVNVYEAMNKLYQKYADAKEHIGTSGGGRGIVGQGIDVIAEEAEEATGIPKWVYATGAGVTAAVVAAGFFARAIGLDKIAGFVAPKIAQAMKDRNEAKKAEYKGQDAENVVKRLKNKIGDSVTTYDALEKRLNLPTWQNDLAKTDGEKAYLAHLKDEVSLRASEAREQGNQGSQSVKTFLQSELDRAGTMKLSEGSGRRFSLRRGATTDGSVSSKSKESEITPEQKAEADKAEMRRSVMLNLLRSGQDKGLPITFEEGKDSVEEHLKDYESIYLTGANEAQKESYADLKNEVSTLAHGTIIGDHIVAQLEPHADAFSRFQTEALRLLGTAGAGVDLNSTDPAVHKVAGAQLLLLASNPARLQVSDEARAQIIDKVVNPLLNATAPTQTVEASVKELAATPITAMLSRQRTLTNAQEKAMWEKYYRQAFTGMHETHGTAFNRDGATFVDLERDIDSEINANSGANSRIDALKTIKADIAEARRPIKERRDKIAKIEVKMDACWVDPADHSQGFLPGQQRVHKRLEREKQTLQQELIMLEKPRPKPAKGQSPPSQPQDDGKTVAEVLAGKLPAPREMAVLRNLANQAGSAEITLKLSAGLDPKVSAVEIKSAGNTESMGLSKFRDRIVDSYKLAGNEEAAREVRGLTDRQFEQVLTDSSRGLDLVSIEQRGTETDARSGVLGKSGTTGRVFVMKWIIGSSLSVLGVGATQLMRQRLEQNNIQPDLGAGLHAGPGA